MITCPNCNKELEDFAQFCDGCGSKITATVFCANCGKNTDASAQFCEFCGAPIAAAEATETPKKAFPIKWAILGAVAAAAIIAIVIFVISLISGGSGADVSAVAYLKDDELFLVEAGDIEDAWQVSSDLYDDKDAYFSSSSVKMSRDGKVIFFADKLSNDDNGYDLYYRDAKDPDDEAIKIASDVSGYDINEDGSFVIFESDDTLYWHDLEEKTKIAEDVNGISYSDDLKTIYYKTSEDGELFRKVYGDDEKVKIDSDVASLTFISEDFNTIYYTKDDGDKDEDDYYSSSTKTLYMKKGDDDKVKIASDINDIIVVYENGEVYYTKANEASGSLLDYVIDDMKEADAALVEPVSPSLSDYRSGYSYNWDAYYAAQDAYYEAYEKWNEKEDRDYIRENLKDEKPSFSSSTLYFYNGDESVEISKDYSGYSDYAADTPVLLFSTLSTDGIEKVKISEVNYYWEVSDKIQEAIDDGKGGKAIAVKEAFAEVSEDDISNVTITDDGKTLYYFTDIDDEKPKGDVYKASVSKDGLGKAELYDEDVSTYKGIEIIDGKVVYFKGIDGYDDNKGELFIDQEAIADDVYSVYWYEDADMIIVSTDYNSEKERYTLNILDGSELKKVDDDVYSRSVLDSGEIFYLRDYKDGEGDLYFYDGGDPELVDSDVERIISLTHNNSK